MTTFNWPLNRWVPRGGTFRPRPLGQLSASPFTGASKAAGNGAIWVAEQTWPAQETEVAHEIQAFLDQLEGAVNPVWIPYWPKWHIRAFTDALGQPWSDGTFFTDGTGWAEPAWSLTVAVAALAGARVVTMTGFPVSQTVLYPGDVVSVGRNMIEITSQVFSDGAGVAMVPFVPGLIAGVLAGDVVTYINPRVLMRLDPSGANEIERDIVHSQPFTLRFVEAVDVE